METFIYNKDTNNRVGEVREGHYLVDGLPGWLPEELVELVLIPTDPPEYDSGLEYLRDIWTVNLENNTYEQSYEVFPYTEQEIAMRGWHHPEFEQRIVAPDSLVNDYPAIGVHMIINKLPIEPSEDGNLLYLYMDFIRPEHQALVDSLQGVLMIEDRPVQWY